MRVRLVAAGPSCSTDTTEAPGSSSSTKRWRRSTGPGSRRSASACGWPTARGDRSSGIAADTKYNSHHRSPPDFVYLAARQDPGHPHHAAGRRVGRERAASRLRSATPSSRSIATCRSPACGRWRSSTRERRRPDAIPDRRRRRHGARRPRAGDGRPVRTGGLHREPPHAGDRDPHGHRRAARLRARPGDAARHAARGDRCGAGPRADRRRQRPAAWRLPVESRASSSVSTRWSCPRCSW